MKTITFEPGKHQNREVIFIRMPYDPELVERVKQLIGRKYCRAEKSWYVPDTNAYRERFKLPPKDNRPELLRIQTINHHAFQQFIENLQLRGYSAATLRTYRNEFTQFLLVLGGFPVERCSEQQLRRYFLYCHNHLHLSEAAIHSRFNAIKFYYEKVLRREKLFFEIPRPKKAETLPKVIHQTDVVRLFACTNNLKHNTMLKLCYGMGLRVSEITSLKLSDIDIHSKLVFIERAKGKKDRYVNLPLSIIPQLQQYITEYHPEKYLFEGQYGGRYSIRSAQQIFDRAPLKT
ncbi:MAG: tyrosine-type recombinase/integrase [Chitinophagales bacterium]